MIETQTKITLFWFRRDLRLFDNAGLYQALKGNKKVQCIFIFDKEILDKLRTKNDARVEFIHQCLIDLNNRLKEMGSSLWVFYGKPIEVFLELIKKYEIENVYCNHDYEPLAIERDASIKDLLQKNNIEFFTYKDQCIFEKLEVAKDDGSPYTVFTPYMKKWKLKMKSFYVKAYPCESFYGNFNQSKEDIFLNLENIGFRESGQAFPKNRVDDEIIIHYQERRDFPSLEGTSKLSMHLRFGTVSIRQLTKRAMALNETWLNELIWRDFYMMILYNFPHVVGKAFKPAYDFIPWRNNAEEFEKWCNGQTGYPIVDAGMRELNQTGFMHNRLRMIVASFLTKHLLIDWRWGEAYFAEKLNDFELSSNNGGWQWAASSGCDAAPYFRVFSPYEQTKRFDPKCVYIKKWVPEYLSNSYPRPIVDHVFARKRVLETYKNALK